MEVKGSDEIMAYKLLKDGQEIGIFPSQECAIEAARDCVDGYNAFLLLIYDSDEFYDPDLLCFKGYGFDSRGRKKNGYNKIVVQKIGE